jgi:hypothetical protein
LAAMVQLKDKLIVNKLQLSQFSKMTCKAQILEYEFRLKKAILPSQNLLRDRYKMLIELHTRRLSEIKDNISFFYIFLQEIAPNMEQKEDFEELFQTLPQEELDSLIDNVLLEINEHKLIITKIKKELWDVQIIELKQKVEYDKLLHNNILWDSDPLMANTLSTELLNKIKISTKKREDFAFIVFMDEISHIKVIDEYNRQLLLLKKVKESKRFGNLKNQDRIKASFLPKPPVKSVKKKTDLKKKK